MKMTTIISLSPGNLFRMVMTDQERENTISNLINHMSGINGPKRDEITGRQLGHFFRTDKELAIRVAKGLTLISNPEPDRTNGHPGLLPEELFPLAKGGEQAFPHGSFH
jgi:hypothetical protein